MNTITLIAGCACATIGAIIMLSGIKSKDLAWALVGLITAMLGVANILALT